MRGVAAARSMVVDRITDYPKLVAVSIYTTAHWIGLYITRGMATHELQCIRA